MSNTTKEEELYTILNRVAGTAYCNGAEMDYPSDLKPLTPIEAEKLIRQYGIDERLDEFAITNGIWGEAESVSPRSAGTNIHNKLINRQAELTALKQQEKA